MVDEDRERTISPAPRRRIRFPPSKRATLQIETHGQAVPLFDDLYHRVLVMQWRSFFAFVGATWLGVNLFFALLYYAVPGSVAGARHDSLEDAFYFSVQTLATIGYGAMAPATRYGHAVVVVEALVGTLGVALVTGATFAKFARPTARVLFSEKAVVHLRDGVPHLAFRMANWRGNMVVEGQLSVMLLLLQTTREGDSIRVPVELPLVRARSNLFALSWTPMHRIDESSPFWPKGGPSGPGGWGAALDGLRAQQGQIFLSFTGLDETLGASIHARHVYTLDDIVLNARFVDVLTIDPGGKRVIDYSAFHDVERLGDPEDMVAPDERERRTGT
jgi:inward rectifier potassium channel